MMKKKIKLVLLILLFFLTLFLGSKIFAFVSYSRDPAGYSITSPVSFDVELSATPNNLDYWWLMIKKVSGAKVCSDDYVASTTLSYIFEITFPLGSYNRVLAEASNYPIADKCGEGGEPSQESLEWDGGDVIFEIVEAEPPPTFFSFDVGDLASTTAYISDIFSSGRSLFFLTGGIYLAFYVIKKMIRFFPM